MLTEPGVDRSDEQIYLARLDRQLTNLKQEYENLQSANIGAFFIDLKCIIFLY